MTREKIIAMLSAATMTLSCLGGLVCAESNYELNVSSLSGVTVETPIVNYIPGKSIGVDFNIKNTLSYPVELTMILCVEDESYKTLADSQFTRTVNPGETVPVDFGVNEFAETGKVNVTVRVFKPGVMTDIYVSQEGDDSAEGTIDKPLKTVSAAVKKVEAMNQKDSYRNEDVTVLFKEGYYRVPETVTVSSAASSNLSSLTFKGMGEDTVFYGGVSVKGSDFTKVTDSKTLAMFPESVSGKLYSLDLSDYGVETNFADGSSTANDPIYNYLYYNGETEQIAKYPNDEYAKGTATVVRRYDAYIDTNEAKAWENYDEAWLRGWLIYEWDLMSGQIGNVSEVNQTGERTITLERFFAESIPGSLPVTNKNREWFVYNLPSELDVEGEYVIKDNVIYYYPDATDVESGYFNDSSIFINTDSNNILEITSSDGITVEGITFENSAGNFINAKADNVTIAGCKFINSAKDAVVVSGYDNLVTSCDFENIGAIGLTMSGGNRNTLTSSGSVVENCYFNKTGQVKRTNNAALSLKGCGVTAKKNKITNTPHVAISYNGNNHIVEYNEITSCLTDGTNDAGLLYVGADLSTIGNVVRNNYFHDSNSGYGAIYWDDWLSGQIAEGNVLENIGQSFLIHGGIANTFNNNIIINADSGINVCNRYVDIWQNFDVTYVNDAGQTVTESKKFNMWDTAPLLKVNQNTANGYNPYNNVILGNLVGIYHDYTKYPGVAWESDVWQRSYKHVLKYINNKPDNTACDNEFSGNYFVNTPNEINPDNGLEMSDLVINEENILGATSLTAEKQVQYNDVVENSGIYTNEYRTVK